MEEKGSTPLPSYAGRDWTPIHFPATYLSSALGVAQPFEFCSTTAQGFWLATNQPSSHYTSFSSSPAF